MNNDIFIEDIHTYDCVADIFEMWFDDYDTLTDDQICAGWKREKSS